MQCKMKAEQPGEIEFTLSITLKAKHWEQLREQLKGGSTAYPAWQLSREIDALIEQVKKTYHPNIPSCPQVDP